MKKIIVVLLTCALLFSFVSCTENTKDTDKSPYSSIIEEYKELLNAQNNSEKLSKPGASADDIEVALYNIVNDCTEPLLMGYATKDINGDGIEELVLLNKRNFVYAVFTIKNDKPVLLLKMGDVPAITSDGTIYSSTLDKGKGERHEVKKIVDGKLEGLEYGTLINGDSTSFYKIEDGIRTEITKEEKLNYDMSFYSVRQSPWRYTKNTGFKFIPAIIDSSVQVDAPVADFSSYDAILSGYKRIVESFSEYTRQDWINGKFDDLFIFKDNTNYDIFHNIFAGAIDVMPKKEYFGTEYAGDGNRSYGYAKKDLNSDGIEELILLNDVYEIICIFTMKDGKSVMLNDTHRAWIDENGLIRVSKWTGGDLDRDGEVYVYEIKNSKSVCVVGVGYKVNIYLQKDNWYKIENRSHISISTEEGEELYAQYDILPQGYSEEEYTRTFSKINFIPLFEKAVPTDKHVDTFSNSTFVNGNTLNLSQISGDSLDFTFVCVKSDGVFDPETGVEPQVHRTTVIGKATFDSGKYSFDQDGISGYIELAVNSAWLVVTESQNEYVDCRAYLFDFPKNR